MIFGWKRFNFMTMIILYFKSVPVAALYRILKSIIDALTPSIGIIVTARFIDTAIIAVGDRSRLNEVYVPLILLIILSLYNYYAHVITHLVMTSMWNKLRIAVMPVITEKRAKLKFKYYEDQESLDIINRVTDGFDGRIAGFYTYLLTVIGIIVQLAGFLMVLSAQIWWASFVFLFASVPSFIVAYIFGKKQYNNEKELTKIDRKVKYYQGILTGRDTIDERYIYNYTKKINDNFHYDYETARISRNKLLKKWWTSNKLVSVITFLGGVLIIGLLIPFAIFPNEVGEFGLSVGMLIALVNAVMSISAMMQGSITENIKEFKYKMEYIKDFNNFLKFEEEANSECLPSTEVPVLETIEFKNVSFKYPGDGFPYILKNFNLTLHAGKHYAIVGTNGAGKTTLTKILTKLYDNYEGDILINGHSLREYSHAKIKSLISVAYQDFCRYPLDFYHNIAIGNILDIENKDVVEKAVSTIGLTDVIEKLPRGYETPITKIKKDGVDLSGGEWQRIALARLIINSSPLKILDEPTSALDPISESHVYKQFSKIVNQTGITLFISHRLGSTKLADEIIVISEGKVAEQGTFDELIEHGGLYAEMFKSQAEWYRNEDTSDE